MCGAIGVVTGHNWPIFLEFRGEKRVATVLGVSLLVQPWLTLVSLAPALLLELVARNLALGTALAFVHPQYPDNTTSQGSTQVLLCLVLTAVVATHFGTPWRDTITAIGRGRLLNLFSFE